MVFGTLLLLVVLSVLLIYVYWLFADPPPLFTLNDRNATYRIIKVKNVFYVVKIDPERLQNGEMFEGDAMRVVGGDINLDQYLNQDVQVEGILSTKSGVYIYHLTSLKKL